MESQDGDCVICLSEPRCVVLTACGHNVLCTECLEALQAQSDLPRCPVCNTCIPEGGVAPQPRGAARRVTRAAAGTAACRPSGGAYIPSAVNPAHAAQAQAMRVTELGRSLADEVTFASMGRLENLLNSGAPPDALSLPAALNDTPLFIAAHVGRPEVVRLLLSRGADAALRRQRDQCTALHVAMCDAPEDASPQQRQARDELSGQVVSLLLAAGAPKDAQDSRQWTPLHSAACRGCLSAGRALIAAGADVAATGELGVTALHWAATSGHAAFVKLLLSAGADRSVRNTEGESPLHAAALDGHDDCARALLEHRKRGPTPKTLASCRDSERSTPLHFACAFGHMQVATTLLRAGADVRATDVEAFTPLIWAARRGHAGLVRLLMSHGGSTNALDRVGWSAMHHAAEGGHVAVMEQIAGNSALLNARDVDRDTPLSVAACNGQMEALRWLMRKGARLQSGNCVGLTALHLAALHGQDECAMALLAASPALAALKDCGGGTALHATCAAGMLAFSRTMWAVPAWKAQADAVDNEGRTALHRAAERGHAAMVRWLVAQGFDANAHTLKGETPSQLATDEAVRALLRGREGAGPVTRKRARG